jgi:hypothetical protein
MDRHPKMGGRGEAKLAPVTWKTRKILGKPPALPRAPATNIYVALSLDPESKRLSIFDKFP